MNTQPDLISFARKILYTSGWPIPSTVLTVKEVEEIAVECGLLIPELREVPECGSCPQHSAICLIPHEILGRQED